MKTRYGRFLVQFVAVLAASVLQIGAVRFNWNFEHQTRYLDFGTRTLSIALLVVTLGITSGVILALILVPGKQSHSKKEVLLQMVVLGILPAFAVVLKLTLAIGMVPFSPLRPFLLQAWEWATNSQVPSFWLGLVIGWTVKQQWA